MRVFNRSSGGWSVRFATATFGLHGRRARIVADAKRDGDRVWHCGQIDRRSRSAELVGIMAERQDVECQPHIADDPAERVNGQLRPEGSWRNEPAGIIAVEGPT